MKRFAIPAISLAALMASGVAFAQTTPDQQPSTQPSQEMQQKQDPGTTAPATPDPSQSSEQPKTDTTAQQPPAGDTGLTVNVDAGKAVLATSFIGSAVYTSTDENIGDINDLIFDDKGAIQAAIVGVGGFLGMGEKDVALPLNKITVTKDENNAVKLTVQASREELEKAPAFDKTLFLVKAPAAGSSTTPSTGGSTTTPQ
ncbi:MAG: PRC-barrel domain-containing protein [Parvibaculaceae bacterium]